MPDLASLDERRNQVAAELQRVADAATPGGGEFFLPLSVRYALAEFVVTECDAAKAEAVEPHISPLPPDLGDHDYCNRCAAEAIRALATEGNEDA